ncbi:P-loop NTPase family protein [Fusibacter bizertensis]
MNKIYIIGNVGSGKTTLAKKLSRKLDIKNYEVDNIVHRNTKLGRIKQSEEDQILEFKRINETNSWIIEGTFRPSCKYLLETADLIIFLDVSMKIRKYRIVKRFIKQQLGLEKSSYKSNLKMLKAMFRWTNDFEKTRHEFEEMLYKYESKLTIIRAKKEIGNAMRNLIEYRKSK